LAQTSTNRKSSKKKTQFQNFPKKYVDAGAKLHKGILLCGKPGTGKTLIARATTGESGVNFIFLKGSDFDEVFVDSFLTKSQSMSMEHSSSRATINKFLEEMDGFEKMEQVFLMGATNHDKDLDPAAVRPGRFDKRIHINVPDEDGRVEIIKYYLNKIISKKDTLDHKFSARMTTGFTGAEIENLVNLSIIGTVDNSE
jgi:ATP-dependent metalloprotease